MGFDVAMHYTLRMAKVERLQHFEDVVPNIKVAERFVKSAEVYIASVYKLHDQGRCFSHRVTNHIKKVDDVDAVF